MTDAVPLEPQNLSDPAQPRAAAPPSLDQFVAQYRSASPMMLRYLLRATGNDRALAEDLTADVFVRAMQSYQHGNQAAIETAYLMTSARNRLIDHLRRRETEERKLALAHASDDSSTPLNADAHSFLNGLESRLTAQWEAARSDTTSERPQERASERSSERTNETQSFRSGS